LVLVPTALELARLQDLGGLGPGALVTPCGFGAIAAAARTAELIARLTPARVILVGIAGAFDVLRDPPGSALEFGAVAVTGVGVGYGKDHLPPPALGFPQWPASDHPAHPAVFDRLELAWDARARGNVGPLLLTCCAASASPEEARERSRRFPEARAEDMEGFAVALACSVAGVPLTVVRGISNAVGDRVSEHWTIPRALASARELALSVLARGGGGA
jgi:futalosine hydrolase